MDFNGHDWVEVTAGFSCLGSDDSDPYASDTERPLREVYVPIFLISRYPTTNLQVYRFFIGAGYTPHPSWGDVAENRYPETLVGREDYPATFISWDIATAYCSWLSCNTGRRITLATEAEWEKAARGDNGRIWPWGDVFDPNCCCCAESGRGDFCSVREYASGASPYGVMHMAGGVWEWCTDFHHFDNHWTVDYYAPCNAAPARQRVVKGGSAFCTKEIVRPACRDWTNSVNQGGADDGMRVILRVE